jgi:hypothetical protein
LLKHLCFYFSSERFTAKQNNPTPMQACRTMSELDHWFFTQQSPPLTEETLELLAQARYVLSLPDQSEAAFLGAQFVLMRLGLLE